MPAALVLTAIAMVAFAANSLLARLALVDGAMDAAGFTGLRLASGALALAVVLAWRRRSLEKRPGTISAPMPGSWISAMALFVYAAMFSFAYLELGAGTGALVLFTSVQMTMIGWGLVRGERPGTLQAAGIVLALAGFFLLVGPSAEPPDPLGALLMIVSGIAWGVYSLRGRGGSDPAGETAGNFIRTAPIAVVLLIGSISAGNVTAAGVWLSLASGILASAGGYVIWYRALPLLTATRAAIVQLSVPVIATLGGVLFIGEALSVQLVAAAVVILTGIWLAITGKAKGATQR